MANFTGNCCWLKFFFLIFSFLLAYRLFLLTVIFKRAIGGDSNVSNIAVALL